MSGKTDGFELVVLPNGSRSIRSLAHGETMHVGTDPVTESRRLHAGQLGIAQRASAWGGPGPFVVWDVGLGPAANAIAALKALESAWIASSSPEPWAEIHSFEIATDVLEFALSHASELGYLAGREALFVDLLSHGVCHPMPGLLWRLHRGDFSLGHWEASAPSAVMFDPYSPLQNADMWTLDLFTRMRAVVSPSGCLLTNYTRSTPVRVTMLLAGWFVGRGIATGGKEETTVAATDPSLLDDPLDLGWLARVRSSTSSAPLRGSSLSRAPISPGDYALLEAHPQFR